MLHVIAGCQSLPFLLGCDQKPDPEHPPVKPITRQKSLMEVTAERIRDAIIEGELTLGSKVSEQKLADLLGISRSPVREALALLQIEGLIRVLPKRGSFVFTPDEKTVDDLCDHRAILETACLDFAIRRNHDRLMAGLRRGMESMEHAIRRDDSIAYAKGDITFHRAIVDASDNGSITQVYTRTIGPLMAVRTNLFAVEHAHLQRSMSNHADLTQACADRDIARAQAIATEHIMRLSHAFRAMHSGQGQVAT